jgi:aminocarboxymuconate-semialdehyde decarboxylase
MNQQRDLIGIDVHAHMVPAGATRAGAAKADWHGVAMRTNHVGGLQWDINGVEWNLTWGNPETGFAKRLEAMDAMGIRAQVLSLSPAMYWYDMPADGAVTMTREVNESIAEAVESHPTRFLGLAHLPLQDPKAAVRELEHAVGTLGLVGAAVSGNVRGANWDDEELFPVLEAAAALDAMIFIHPATNVRFPAADARYFMGNLVAIPVETTVAFASLVFGGVFDRLPTLRVCLAHGGGYACMGIGRFDHGRRVRRECQDITAAPSDYAARVWWDSLTHSYQALRFLIESVGSSQVVVGTDYPADMGQVDPISWLEGADLSPDERSRILDGNVKALVGRRGSRLFASATR